MEEKSKTYLTPDGRLVGWRWQRVPVILWLILFGSAVSALMLMGRIAYLLARRGPIQPADDFNLTVFMFLLAGGGTLVFSLVMYLLARPERPDID